MPPKRRRADIGSSDSISSNGISLMVKRGNGFDSNDKEESIDINPSSTIDEVISRLLSEPQENKKDPLKARPSEEAMLKISRHVSQNERMNPRPRLSGY